jgi:hypothetical protein
MSGKSLAIDSKGFRSVEKGCSEAGGVDDSGTYKKMQGWQR